MSTEGIPLSDGRDRSRPALSRRALLQTGAGAGIIAGTGGLLAPAPAAAQTPVGATLPELRIAMAALPPRLDPHVATWIVMQRMYSLLCDTLIRRDWSQDGALAPRLATAWERIDDVTLELTLRDDVLFHDGAPFTAADVKYTLDRTLQGNPNLGASGDFPIATVEAVDDYLVRITTDGVDGAFELRLTTPAAAMLPAAYLAEVGDEEFQMRPVGTGPYRLTEFVPDNRLSFEAHEAYFEGVPAAERVTVRAIPEISTRIAALLNDEVDLIVDLPADQIATIEEAGGFTVNSASPLNVNLLVVNGLRVPTDKKEVRQALSLAIDRGAIIEQLLGGHGLWPGSVQSEFDLLYVERPPLPYDPERARQLLDEAGYAGEEIIYVYDTPNYYPLQREWSEVIVGMWREVGLNVTMRGVDVSERTELTAEDDVHLITTGSEVEVDVVIPSTFGGPDTHYQSVWYPEGYWSEMNELVEQAVATVDPEERGTIYQDVLDIMNEETMVVVLFTINRLNAMKDSIAWTPTPEWSIDLRPGKLVIA